MTDDIKLLQEYASSGSEEAFATLVARHLNLVYSVALRRVANSHQAQEIAQAVFIILARKAASLRPGTVLSSWLFQTTRLTVANFVRSEMRRTQREQEAYLQSLVPETNPEAWQQIAPLLDDALAHLAEKDRSALLLRFMEGKDFKEVGVTLGTTEDGVRMRVNRAVAKLRKFFTARGVVLTEAVLIGAIAANSVQAAPAGLAIAITAAATKGTVLTASTLTLVKGTLKIMAWTKVKIAVGVCAATLVAWQWHQNFEQKHELQSVQARLQQREHELAAQTATIEKLKQEQSAMAETLHASTVEKARLIGNKKAAVAAAVAAVKTDTKSGGNGTYSSALSKMMDAPEMKEFMRQQTLTTIKTQYAPLLKQLQLTPEAGDKFMQLLTDYALKNLDRTSAMMRGDGDKTQFKQEVLRESNEMLGQMRSLLGEEKFAQYQDFSESIPARTILKLFKDQLEDSALNDDQSARLLALMKAETKRINHDPSDSSSLGAADGYFQRQTESNQRILQQANAFLTPEQLDAYAKFQTNMLNMSRASIKMGQQMISNKTN